VIEIVDLVRLAWDQSRDNITKLHSGIAETAGLAIDDMTWSLNDVNTKQQDFLGTHESIVASMLQTDKSMSEQGEKRRRAGIVATNSLVSESTSAVSIKCKYINFKLAYKYYSLLRTLPFAKNLVSLHHNLLKPLMRLEPL
jgi:hypothetical protein